MFLTFFFKETTLNPDLRNCPGAIHLTYQLNDAQNQPAQIYSKDDSHFFTFMSLLHVFLVTLATVLTCTAFCFLQTTRSALTKIDGRNTIFVPGKNKFVRGENKFVPNTPKSSQEPVSYFDVECVEYDDGGDGGGAVSTTEPKGVKSESFLHKEHTYEAVE